MAPVSLVDGKLMIDLHPIRTDEQMGRVVELIREDLGAELLLADDYPYYRKSILQLDGKTLTVKFSSQEGVWVEADDPAARPTLERIRAFFADLLED